MFFEQAREQAEREYKANNKDALALTKWGGALLELAHFRQGNEAYSMIEDAIRKFEEALDLDSKRHDALWCLGNAYTSQGFLSASAEAADVFFTKAGDCFRKAAEFEPDNDSYKRALDMSSKAPQLYAELQKQLQAAGAASSGEAAPSRPAAGSGSKEPLISDFWYDVAGWVMLAGIGVGIAALSSRATSAA
jgi:tetratricopeptide (TPR) repeat protein